jgi:formylglycine-generating enzyme required for sulfatase activity
MISFSCPECRASIRSKRAKPGEQLRCQECQELVTVPDGAAEKAARPNWILIGTAVFGLVAALFMAVAKYYEIHRARAEAARAEAEAERAKGNLRVEGEKKRPKDNSGPNGNKEPLKGPNGNKEPLQKPIPVDDKDQSELKKAFTNSLGMEFVLVPKGRSWLGGGSGMLGTREVVIPHDFYLGVYEVTQEEWQKVMGNNPSIIKAAGGISREDLKRFPVENVTWYDTQEFVKKFNEKVMETGWIYRLPKSDEWEYACRGGPLANKLDSSFDFYLDKLSYQLLPQQANFNKVLGRTCKVGSYKPNRLGLYDMHGNVWEWCDDTDNVVERGSLRVRRGGAWDFDRNACTAVQCYAAPRTDKSSNLGLRLARVPVGHKGQ